MWEAHLEKQLIETKGVPLESYPSNFVFRRGQNDEDTLVLNFYVDDLTLAGGTKEIQQEFWKELQRRVKVEPEEFISETGTKIFGRTHTVQRTPKEILMTNDMSPYAKGFVSFYCKVTGTTGEKLRKVETPCLPESQMSEEELAYEGVLHNHAAKVLMRCLWMSRLARPDLSFAARQLATRVTRWTLWECRKMLRLISYVHPTDHMIQATVGPNESPELVVFTDFDFASCPHTAKSTSGVVYILKTGSARYPLFGHEKNKVQQRDQLLKQS